MSKGLKRVFVIYAVVAAIFGFLLLVALERFLSVIGWAPIDPIISRLLGAELLALGWSSLRGWQATGRRQVAILAEMAAVFTILCCLSLLQHLLKASYPLMVWAILATLLIFAIAWIARKAIEDPRSVKAIYVFSWFRPSNTFSLAGASIP